MSGDRRYTPEEVAAALTETRGLVTLAAKRLGISRQAVNARIKNSKLVRDALIDAREAQLDRTELALFNQIDAGEGWAVIWYLKTLGKGRGYVERVADAPPAEGEQVRRIIIEERRREPAALPEPDGVIAPSFTIVEERHADR